MQIMKHQNFPSQLLLANMQVGNLCKNFPNISAKGTVPVQLM